VGFWGFWIFAGWLVNESEAEPFNVNSIHSLINPQTRSDNSAWLMLIRGVDFLRQISCADGTKVGASVKAKCWKVGLYSVIAVVVARNAARIFRTRRWADLCAVLVFCIAEATTFSS
jgi:hypothetical protein